MAVIPQELIDVVLSNLDPVQDRDSLKCIALSAYNLAVPAQRTLFRSLSLHAGSKRETSTFERALTLFTQSPHLTPYVRDLDIGMPWPEQQAFLSRILPLVTRVRRFVIQGCGVPWRMLSPALQTALYDFTSRPALQKLHLIFISGIPASFISLAARRVPVLSMQDLVVAPDPDDFQLHCCEVEERPPKLTDLTLSLYFKNPWDTLRELGLTPTIERLALDMDDSDDVLDAITAVAPTIRHLELTSIAQLTPRPLPLSTPLALPTMPNLTSLSICLPPEFNSLISPSRLSALMANLSVAQSPFLRELTISIAWPVSARSAVGLPMAIAENSLGQEDMRRLLGKGNAEVLGALDVFLSSSSSSASGASSSVHCTWDLLCDSGVSSTPTSPSSPTSPCTSAQKISRTREPDGCGGYHARVFTLFKNTIEGCMPKTRARGKLEVRRSVRRGYLEGLA